MARKAAWMRGDVNSPVGRLRNISRVPRQKLAPITHCCRDISQRYPARTWMGPIIPCSSTATPPPPPLRQAQDEFPNTIIVHDHRFTEENPAERFFCPRSLSFSLPLPQDFLRSGNNFFPLQPPCAGNSRTPWERSLARCLDLTSISRLACKQNNGPRAVPLTRSLGICCIDLGLGVHRDHQGGTGRHRASKRPGLRGHARPAARTRRRL